MITTDEWKSVRASQKYPIVDLADCTSTSGVALPNSFILDLHIITPELQDTSYFYFISSIYNNDKNYVILISCYKGNNTSLVCLWTAVDKTCNMQDAVTKCYTPLHNVYKGEDTILSKVYGTCTVGVTLNCFTLNLNFQAEATRISPQCIFNIQSAGLLAIKVGDKILTGTVLFKGINGVLVTADKLTNTISFSLDADYIKNQASLYYTNLKATYSTAIQTINNIKPVNGNINIIGLDCVDIAKVGDAGIISVSNSCSKPCCTVSEEALNIQAAIDKITLLHQILKDYYTNQLTVINYMQTNLSTLLAQGVSN